jgi:electron transfer flavoprotein beta subunit
VRIAVLIKQVPATDAILQIADARDTIAVQGLSWVVNPYDEIAVEEALRLRQAHGGSVTAMTVGPPPAEDALRTALALGADEALLIDAPAVGASDGLTVARLLAAAIAQAPFDLIIAGRRAVDDDSGWVGPAVAEALGIPHVVAVTAVQIRSGAIRCHRAVDGGAVVVEARLPALITVERGLNEPRHMSLKGIRAARQKIIAVIGTANLNLPPGRLQARARVAALELPPARPTVEMLAGETAQDKAAALVERLRARGIV